MKNNHPLINHILFDIVLILLFLFAPWWVTAIYAVIGFFVADYPDFIAVFLLYDILFEPFAYTSLPVFFVASLLIFLLKFFLKRQTKL